MVVAYSLVVGVCELGLVLWLLGVGFICGEIAFRVGGTCGLVCFCGFLFKLLDFGWLGGWFGILVKVGTCGGLFWFGWFLM